MNRNTSRRTFLRRGLLATFSLTACGWSSLSAASSGLFGDARALVETSAGTFTFRVKTASTVAARRRGLMGQSTLKADEGMWFDFGRTGPVAMWMKDTLISLDMIFIRADLTIAHIAERTTPHSLDAISAGEPIRYVLEINGGTSRLLGLQPGARVRLE